MINYLEEMNDKAGVLTEWRASFYRENELIEKVGK
jgi:hypothetical protein